MVWNKTSEETLAKIIELVKSDFSLRYKDIAEKFNVSEWLVSENARKHLSKDELTERYSKINHYAKLKSNPMTGIKGMKHHRAKEITLTSGYKTEWAPDWWTGHYPKSGRCFTHQLEWCKANGKTEVPKGHVIHHKDEDKWNNSPDNLQCMTRKQHAQHHCVNNILKKCNDYSDKEVESRALEAQSLLMGG